MKLRRLYKPSPRVRRWLRRRKDARTYWLARLGLWIPTPFSLPTALALADRIGDLAYLILPKTRRLAFEHIEIALGDELPPGARQHLVRASFRNLARCFVELAKFEDIRRHFGDYTEVEGWEHMEEVRALGRGAIVISGHIGNWEILAAYVSLVRGIPLGAIARRIKDPRLNALIVDFRARYGVETILRESPSSSRQILRILNGKGLLAMHIDQDTKVPSISVPFFGRMARTPAAAAILAVRRNLPVLPAFAHRRPQGGHCLTFSAPVYPPQSGDRRRDISEMTRAFNQVIEAAIRRNPAEWVWWHRRWRRKPVPDLDLDERFQYQSRALSQGGRRTMR